MNLLRFNESSLKQDLEYDQLIINPRTDWSLIADRLIEPISRPVNLRRTSSANNTNPWGSTVSTILGNDHTFGHSYLFLGML